MASKTVIGQPSPEIVQVRHDGGVGAARRAARCFSEKAGLEAMAVEEIVLAASELASNLVKHGKGGTLTLSKVTANGRAGVMLEVCDQGPGIPDINQALADGYSTVGSLGTGLGAVNRLMDELDITSAPGCGAQIVCRKWARERPRSTGLCPLEVGAASRPRYLEAANGDSFAIKQWDSSVLVGVIDGLGHGLHAQGAAQAARDYVERHFDLPLDQLFRGVDRACRGTRGVVMALARFDWDRACITTASVGNIEWRVFPASRTNYFEIRRGIIGSNAPNPIVKEHPWHAQNILVLHTDGLRTHWSSDEFPALLDKPAAEIAQGLLRALAKDDDDATALVVRRALT